MEEEDPKPTDANSDPPTGGGGGEESTSSDPPTGGGGEHRPGRLFQDVARRAAPAFQPSWRRRQPGAANGPV